MALVVVGVAIVVLTQFFDVSEGSNALTIVGAIALIAGVLMISSARRQESRG